MKNIIITLFLLGNISCVAQEQVTYGKADSLSFLSRTKADLVLSHFDSIKTTKILYSISDKHYYLIARKDCCYNEYYINTDEAGNIIDQRVVKASNKNKTLFRKAFKLDNYHTNFITKSVDPKVVQGNPSYFVVKDSEGKRYGEYSLSVITVPVPINKKLYQYLLSNLLRESTKK